MSVIGCDCPASVIGADALADKTGVWLKTLFRQDGPYLCATTYMVAAGTPCVFEMRIDLRPLEKIAAKIHKALHERAAASGAPSVGFSFSGAWKDIKKTAKKIGKSKLVRSVGKVAKSIAKSKAVGAVAAALAVFPPTAVIGVPLLAAYGAANTAVKAIDKGKKLVKTANEAKKILDTGDSASHAAATAKAKITADPKATPAGKSIALAELEKRMKPVVERAVKLKAKLADPKVRAELTTIKKQADSAKAAVQGVIDRRRTASTPAEKLSAEKDAAILNLVAASHARINAIADRNAGGLPSLLIDAKGRITPGRYSVKAKASPAGRADVLYLGPGKTESGQFTRVAGARPPRWPVGASTNVMRIPSGYYVIDRVGGAPPPPPRVRTLTGLEQPTRDQVILDWLVAQERKGKYSPRVAGCHAIDDPTGKLAKSLRISGAPGLIGCDCGSEF